MALVTSMLRALRRGLSPEPVEYQGALWEPAAGGDFVRDSNVPAQGAFFPQQSPLNAVGALASEDAPFYLKTERMFADPTSKIPARDSGQGYLNWLKSPKRSMTPAETINPEELRQTGLEAWLPTAEQSLMSPEGVVPKNISREDVLNFLQTNPERPELNRLTLGDPPGMVIPEPSDVPGALAIPENTFSPENFYLEKAEAAEAAGDPVGARTNSILAEWEKTLAEETHTGELDRAGIQDMLSDQADTAYIGGRQAAQRGQDELSRQLVDEQSALTSARQTITEVPTDPNRVRNREMAVTAGWETNNRPDTQVSMDSAGDIQVFIEDPESGDEIFSLDVGDLDAVEDRFGRESEIWEMADQITDARNEAPVYVSERNSTRWRVTDEDGDTQFESDWEWDEDPGDAEDLANEYLTDNLPFDEDGVELDWSVEEDYQTEYEVYDDNGGDYDMYDDISDAETRQRELQNDFIVNEDPESAIIVQGEIIEVDDYMGETYGGGFDPDDTSGIHQRPLSNKPGPAKWEPYSESGGSHYGEEILMYPGVDYHNSTHWPPSANNEVAHSRVSQQETTSGETMYFSEENQSDLGQAASKQFRRILKKKVKQTGKVKILKGRNEVAVRAQYLGWDDRKTNYPDAWTDEQEVKLQQAKKDFDALNAMDEGRFDAEELQTVRSEIAKTLKDAGITGYGIKPDEMDFDVVNPENWEVRLNPDPDADNFEIAGTTGAWEAEFLPVSEVAIRGATEAEVRSRIAGALANDTNNETLLGAVQASVGSMSTGLPDTPFKADANRLLTLKNQLSQAVAANNTWLGITPAWMQKRRYSGRRGRAATVISDDAAEAAQKKGFKVYAGDPDPGDFLVPYERALPKVVTKYFKQLGQATGEKYQLEKVDMKVMADRRGNPGSEPVWAIRLTPRLKAHIKGEPGNPLTGGQSMFSVGGIGTLGALQAQQPPIPGALEPTDDGRGRLDSTKVPDSAAGASELMSTITEATGAFLEQYSSDNIAPPGQRSFVEGGMNDLVEIAAGLENALALGAQGASGVMGALEILGGIVANPNQDTEEVLNRWQGYSYNPRSTQAERQQQVLMDLIRDNPKLRGTLEYLGEVAPDVERSILDTTGSRALSHAGRATLEMM